MFVILKMNFSVLKGFFIPHQFFSCFKQEFPYQNLTYFIRLEFVSNNFLIVFFIPLLFNIFHKMLNLFKFFSFLLQFKHSSLMFIILKMNFPVLKGFFIPHQFFSCFKQEIRFQNLTYSICLKSVLKNFLIIVFILLLFNFIQIQLSLFIVEIIFFLLWFFPLILIFIFYFLQFVFLISLISLITFLFLILSLLDHLTHLQVFFSLFLLQISLFIIQISLYPVLISICLVLISLYLVLIYLFLIFLLILSLSVLMNFFLFEVSLFLLKIILFLQKF